MTFTNIKKAISQKLNLLSFIVPRKKNLWIFGSWEGKLYADNPKYLFEYIQANRPEIRCVWITREKALAEELRKRGIDCFYHRSFRGILCALRAEAAFITSDETSDISPFVSRERTKVIQLFHGVGGKGMNFCPPDKIPALRKRYQSYYWIATSEKYRELFVDSFQTPRERFVITGYPRNDTFVFKPHSDTIEEIRKRYPGARLIAYMPTHRGYGKIPIDISEFGMIDSWLKQNNAVMVYKPHYNEWKNLPEDVSAYTNIIIAKDQRIWGDVYSYIHAFDLLISDYSSIIYDFMCAEKPIVLYTYDIEYMRNDDFGLIDDFEAVPPGPFCSTWEETLNNVSALLKEDTWAEKREVCRNLYHPFRDGNNSKRVYDAVIRLLKENRWC